MLVGPTDAEALGAVSGRGPTAGLPWGPPIPAAATVAARTNTEADAAALRMVTLRRLRALAVIVVSGGTLVVVVSRATRARASSTLVTGDLHGSCRPGAAQSAFDGPGRDAQFPGDLVHRQPQPVVKHENLAVLQRQRTQSGLN